LERGIRGMKKRGVGIRMKGKRILARSMREGGKRRERVQEMTMKTDDRQEG
jgi:hypothetical protein